MNSVSQGKTLVVIVAVVFALVGVLAGLFINDALVDALLVVFAGVLLGVFLRGAGRLVNHVMPVGKRWAVALVLIGVTAVFAGLIWFLAPRVLEQSTELVDKIPEATQRLREQISTLKAGRWALARTDQVGQLMPSGRDVFARVGGVVTGTFGALGIAVVIFFVGVYVAFDPKLYLEGGVKLFPQHKRARVRQVMTKCGASLRGWLLGQMCGMAAIGIMTYAGLKLLKIELAFVLALLAGLLNFVPNLGPIVSMVPAALIGLLHSPMTAVYVVIVYMVAQTIETYLLTPMVQEKTVDLPPAITIVAQLILGVLFGGLGVALAAPLMAITLVLVRSFYIQDVLGDAEDETPAIPQTRVTGNDDAPQADKHEAPLKVASPS